MQENRENNHILTIEKRKYLSVTGVESVTAFSEVKITLTLIGGEKMYIAGSGFKIGGFSKANGTFTAEGVVTGVSYGGKGFTARLFR